MTGDRAPENLDPPEELDPPVDLDPNDPAAFEDYLEAAIAALPPAFRGAARAVMVAVADWPPRAVLRDMGIDDPRDLTGLYEGVPLPEKSVFDQPQAPDAIWLYREPILAEWRDRRAEGQQIDLAQLVAHVYVHELAHHFGWSDDDIAAIDPWWE